MTTSHFRSVRRQWTDPTGSAWTATLLEISQRAADECEIQIDGDGVYPERVLCRGIEERHFRAFSGDDLELIRHAAMARSGILWVDPRENELWWVDEQPANRSQTRPKYSNLKWSGTANSYLNHPVTLLGDTQHQRLLDRARLGH